MAEDYYRAPDTGEIYPSKDWYQAEQKVLGKGMTPTTSNIQKAMSGEIEGGESPGDLSGTMKEADSSELASFANADLPYDQMDQLTLLEMGLQDIGRAALGRGLGQGMKTAWGQVEAKPSEVSGNVVQQMANFVEQGVRSPIVSGLDKMSLMVDSMRKNKNQLRDDSRQLINLSMNQEVWRDMPQSRKQELWSDAGFTGEPINPREEIGGLSDEFLMTLGMADVPKDVANKIYNGITTKGLQKTKDEITKEYGEKRGKQYVDRFIAVAQNTGISAGLGNLAFETYEGNYVDIGTIDGLVQANSVGHPWPELRRELGDHLSVSSTDALIERAKRVAGEESGVSYYDQQVEYFKKLKSSGAPTKRDAYIIYARSNKNVDLEFKDNGSLDLRKMGVTSTVQDAIDEAYNGGDRGGLWGWLSAGMKKSSAAQRAKKKLESGKRPLRFSSPGGSQTIWINPNQ